MASKKLLQSQVVMLSLGSGVYASCVCVVGNPFSAILDRRLLRQAAGSPALEFGFYDPSCQSLVRRAGGSIFPTDLGRRDGWDSCAAIATATTTAPLSTMKVDVMLANSANGGRDQTDLVALSGAAA